MRPDKAIKSQSDRGLDLEGLWRELRESPPGTPSSLDPARRDKAPSTFKQPGREEPAAATSASA